MFARLSAFFTEQFKEPSSMSRKSDPLSSPKPPRQKPLHRRQVLEGLGALAATAACSSGESTPLGHGNGTSGAPGTAGAPANVAGTYSGVAGQPGSASSGGGPATTSGTGGSGATGGSGGSSTQSSAGTGSGGPQQAGAGQGGGASPGGPNGGAPNSGGQPSAASAGAGGTPNSAGGGAGGAGDDTTLVSPPWDDVPTCTASNTDAAGQGPFFIHDLEKSDDISLIRQDMRGRYNDDAEPGVEMHLYLRVLDSTSTSCNQKPVAGADVYIWHTDGQGYYSGFGTRGGADEQKPDTPYAGTPSTTQLDNTDRFLRAVQTTDENGVVAYRTIFPGWYNGRALHIHFVAFKQGSMSEGRVAYTDQNSGGKWLFTTQMYFDPAFAHSIHENNQPYLRRTTLSAYPNALAANETGNSELHFKASLAGDTAGVGGIVTAQMQILLDPKIST
jgi:protocatechuate 3,4-dioxygenase beta subunit